MDINAYIASGIIEQYVLGLCSTEEERELESLRLTHPEIDEAIYRFSAALEGQLNSAGVTPSPQLDQRILSTLGALPPDPVVEERPAPVYPIRKRSPWRWVAAASVILLALSAYYNYALYRQVEQQKEELVAKTSAGEPRATLPVNDYNILKLPTITPVAMYGVGIHAICRCTMFWDKQTRKAYVMIHHLPLSSTGRDYQLWALVNGEPVSVGIIDDSIRGRFIEVENVPANATGFIVTLEKAGGTDRPTDVNTYLRGVL